MGDLLGKTAVAELLGEQAWDALVVAGHTPAPAGCGCDGFDIVRPPEGRMDHVVVIARFEGDMEALGTPGVRRAYFYRWEQSLAAAGFVTGRHEVDGVPFALVVARDVAAVGPAVDGLHANADQDGA
jgi:hypothetical protein